VSDIYQILHKLNIEYRKYDHPAVYTVEEAEKLHLGIKGVHCKSLFLRNKKGDRHYLVIIKANKKADFKRIGTLLDEDHLSFASAERLQKYLGVIPGSVSPLGLINDVEKKIVVIVDSDLLKYDKIDLHANVNTATIVISVNDFKKFLKWSGHQVLFFSI
jgi:Ala-tRNA(Pro) deacylase